MISVIEAVSSGLTTSVTAYTGGDVIGTVFSWPGAVGNRGGHGVVRDAQIIDQSGVLGACELVFFRDLPTAAANNDPTTYSAADFLNVRGSIQFPATGISTQGSRVFATWDGKDHVFEALNTTLYGVLTARSTINPFTAGVDSLTIILCVDTGDQGII
jgi:hypothetical protein